MRGLYRDPDDGERVHVAGDEPLSADGFKQHTASVPRVIGAGLMVAGLALIEKS